MPIPSPPIFSTPASRPRSISRPATPISPVSPLESDASGSTMPVSEYSDDSASISSASSLRKSFTIPHSWPPAIQACIDQETDEARKRELIPTVRSEICRVLANAMFCYDPHPNKDLCTQVAKLLVKKYKFMADVGTGVTGYVSPICYLVCLYLITVCRDLGRRNLLIKFTMLSHVAIKGPWEVILPVLQNQSEGDLRHV